MNYTRELLESSPLTVFSADKSRAYCNSWFSPKFKEYDCYYLGKDGFYYSAGSTYRKDKAELWLTGADIELMT